MNNEQLRHQTWKLLAACLITCLAGASIYLTQSIFPVIAQSYGLPDSAGRLTFTYSSIAYAVAFFVIGPLTDSVSPRALATWGLVGTASALALASSTNHFELLLLALTLMGGAAAAVPAAMFALVPRMAQPKQVGTYFGMLIAASVIGISIGRSVPGLLTAYIGWRGAFLIFAGIIMVSVAFAQMLPSSQYSVEQYPAGGRRRSGSLKSIYVGALTLLIEPRLMRMFLTGFFLFFGYIGTITFLTYRLHEAPLYFNSAQIGAVGFLGLVAIVGAPLSGSLTIRLGSRIVALFSLVVVAIGIEILGHASSVPMVTIGVLTVFFGVFSCQPAIFTMIASQVNPDRRGAASSMYLLTCLSAGSAASWSLGPLWASRGFGGVTMASLSAIGLAGALVALDIWLVRRAILPMRGVSNQSSEA